MRLLLFFLTAAPLLAQAPPITGVGADSITDTTARVYWTAGFYHDAASDTTLTDGFTSAFCGSVTMHVGSTANMRGWQQGKIPTSIIIGGIEWGRVASVVDSTHAVVELDCTGIGASDVTEAFYSTRAGLTISVSANIATATLYYPMPSWWIVGHHFLIHYAKTPNLASDNYTIASVVDSTHFTFRTSGVPNGTYNFSNEADIWLESGPGAVHAAGETVSFLGTDNMVCYGDPGGPAGTYSHSVNWREDSTMGYQQAAQSSKHYAYLTGQTPASTIHYIVLSTPRQLGVSNCASIGAHTGQSPDQTLTFHSSASEPKDPTKPTGVDFSTALPDSYTDSKTVGTDCPDLQACLNAVRSAPGNHELKIPAGTTLTAPAGGGWTLPPQTNGSIITTIRSTAADTDLPAPGACLPPLIPNVESPCIDNPKYASQLATLQTGDPNTPSSVFRVSRWTKADGIHFGPGLKLQANPHYALRSRAPLINIGQAQGDGQYDHASHSSNIVVDRVYFYQKHLGNGALGAVQFLGGNSLAVVDSVIEGIGSRVDDLGGINLASMDPVDGGIVIKNNRIQAASMPFYFGDSGWNTSNALIQRNWLHFSKAWHPINKEYTTQVQIAVANTTPGATTTVAPADPIETALGYSPFAVSFDGYTGTNWSKLNAQYFQLIDDTLTDFNCDGAHCTATTSSPHGLSTGQYVWVGGVGGYPCSSEMGAHQITGTSDSTHFQYASGTNAHCIYPAAFLMGPVFYATGSATSFTIPFNSSTFGAATGTPTVRYGFVVDAKNLGECKTCRFVEISGNIFEYSIGHEQNAAGFTLTNRIAGSWQDVSNYASTSTISDINFHDNWFRSIGAWMPMGGIQDNGASVPMSRVSVTNNLVTDSSPLQCLPGENCFITALGLQYGTHMVFNHNTVLSPAGITGSGMYTPPAYGDFTFTNSIAQFGGTGFAAGGDTQGHGHTGAQMFQTSGTCHDGPCAVPNPPYPNSFTWGKNALIGEDCLSATGCRGGDPWGWQKRYYDNYTAGVMATDYQGQYWPRYDVGVGFAGLTAIKAATNAAPIVLTTSTMSCVPNVGDRVRVSGVQGNTAANGNWVVRASTATSLTLLATKGDGAYTSGGTVIPLTGACNTSANWGLGATSPYRARTLLVLPSTDLTTAGKGPASDGTDVGVDIDKLNSAIGGSGGTACNFTIDPQSVTYAAAGDSTLIFVIASAPSCSWSVSDVPDWIAFDVTSGVGTGQVTATISTNVGGSQRRASPIIAGQTFSVSQDAPADQTGVPDSTGFGSGIGQSSSVAAH